MLFGFSAFGQTFEMNAHSLINSCNGFFTDSGNLSNNYGNNENLFTTICKDGNSETHIRLSFAQVNIAQGDELCFFDGLDNTAPLLACASDYSNNGSFIVQATAANSSGCITVSFNSNGTETGKGWEANISCVPSCQLVQAALVRTNPVAVPADTGWIDICPGEQVYFEAEGIYPQNGIVYSHSDETSHFEWDFGDGNFGVGKNVLHQFNKPGGYKVSLKITDRLGCSNSNLLVQRVRVSVPPAFNTQIPPEICQGEIVHLSASVSTDSVQSTIEVTPQKGVFLFNGIRSDSLALPDGNGTSYETSINFGGFSPGQVLTNINDLQSICVNMEHSWLHDMEISITCPSGKSVLLQNQMVINEEVYLGVPNDNDDINPKDGMGLDYCWAPKSTKGTFTDFANLHDNSSPSKPYFLPTGTYNSFENLEALLGCPLNGNWTITVTDLWGQDNGWIFSWSIDFNPELYPSLESFESLIEDIKWQNSPDIINYTPDVISVKPNNIGVSDYTLEVTDDFGCQYDTTVLLNVLPSEHPNCLNCDDSLFSKKVVTICEGQSIELEQFIIPEVLGSTSFETEPNYEFSFSTHPTNNPYNSSIQVIGAPNSQIAADGGNILSVCVDLSSEYNADLSLELIAPNGQKIDLSSENGGSSDGYLNTCFTAIAPQSITEGIGPFMGDYRPEEDFSGLAAAPINGLWQLSVSDDAGLADSDVNVLKSWSITFKMPNPEAFSWAASPSLSCSDCTNPTASPDSNTTYILEKNLDGCQVIDSIRVNIMTLKGPSGITSYSLAGGKILINWSAVLGAEAYEISLNGIDWLPPSGHLSHVAEGFDLGEEQIFLVRAINKSINCQTQATNHLLRYTFCDLKSELVNPIFSTSCINIADGSVELQSTGGRAPYTYTLNDSLIGLNNQLTGLQPGDYWVFVQDDSKICADTLAFTVKAAPPIEIKVDIKNPSCFGRRDGKVSIMPSGGAGGFQVLNWSHTSERSFQIDNLADGNYIVTISDQNNCQVIDTVLIEQPEALKLTPSAAPVHCKGGNNGAASVKVTGGNPIYQYEWDVDSTKKSSSIIGLSAGQVRVKVTDSNGCIEQTSIDIPEPEALQINFTPTPVSCPGGQDGSLLAEVSGGIVPYNYTWENKQSDKKAIGLEAGKYILTIVDSKGCEKIDSHEVTTLAPLVLSPIQLSPSCENQSTGSAQIITSGGQAPYNYFWNDAQQQKTAIIDSLSSGNYEITVIDANGCQDSATLFVGLFARSPKKIDITPVSCFDKTDGAVSINLLDKQGDYTFLWENGDTSSSRNNLAKGWYAYIIEDEKGCQLMDSIEIKGPDPLKIESVTPKPPSCTGFQNGSIEMLISGGVSPYKYIWNNNENDHPPTNLEAGNYEIRIEDANGCRVSPIKVALEEPKPLVLESSKLISNSCKSAVNGQILLNVTGGKGNYSYKWSNGSQTKDLIYVGAGQYAVTIKDANNCEIQETFELEDSEALSGSTQAQQISCFGANDGQITIDAQGGAPPYNFSLDGHNYNGIQNIIGLKPDTYKVYIKDRSDCIWESSLIRIESPKALEVEIISAETNIAYGDSIQLYSNFQNNIGQVQYSWNASTPNSFECKEALCQNIVVKPKNPTIYEIYAVDENGCEATDKIHIFVKKDHKVHVPTGFSPDNNGKNDRLIVHGKENIDILSFKIFDRWGTVVFNTTEMKINNPSDGWDGTYKGKLLNHGIFTWILEVKFPDGEIELIKGHSTLIR
jgi:gliding motility-associated-like protein